MTQIKDWKIERCLTSDNEHIYCLIHNSWQRRTLRVDIRNQQIVGSEQGWLLSVKDDIWVTSLANLEDDMFGHNLLDVRINGQVLPIQVWFNAIRFYRHFEHLT